MTLQLDSMSQRVIKLLKDDPAMRYLNFHLKGPGSLSIHVHRWDYYTIATRIEAEKSPGVACIKCIYNPAYEKSGISSYNRLSDTLELGSQDFKSLDMRALLVHEATHAINDLHRLKNLPNVYNEASAYIAQCLYAIKNGLDMTQHLRPKFREAGKIAQKIADGKLYTVSIDESKYLLSAIADLPMYSETSYESVDLDGISSSPVRHERKNNRPDIYCSYASRRMK